MTPEARREYFRNYRKKNLEFIRWYQKEYHREYSQKNKEKLNEYRKERRLKNK